MQRYQCHKIVEAAKVASIIGATVRLHGDDPAAGDVGEIVSVSASWLSRFKPTEPNDLGYFVRYADGYESWSPTAVFEAGYALVDAVGLGKLVVELSWDPSVLSEGWMNMDNLRTLLYGETKTRSDLLAVRKLASSQDAVTTEEGRH